ncbi:MAG: ABC transporter permease [Pedobacter sp.]|nr:MAG: ABC transporter permease [Pedobacter sp.]
MNLEYFISKRIALKTERTFSKLIVKIAIIGVMLSLAAMILSVGIIKGFKSEIQSKVRGFMGDVQIYRYDLNGSFEKAPFIPNPETLNFLKTHPQIAYFSAFATKPAIMIANDEVEGVTFKGVDRDYNWSFIEKNLMEGRVIKAQDTISNPILVSNYIAKRMKLKVGDRILLQFVQNPPKPRKFTLIGIYNVGIEQVDQGFVLGELSMIKQLNQWPNEYMGGIEVKLHDFKHIQEASNDIFKGLDENLRSRSILESNPEIFTWLDLLDVNTEILIVLMLIVGLINMITALLIMILEKTNMIGLLKALGARNSQIMRIFIYNILYLVGLGLILGNILGLGLAYLQIETKLIKLDQSNYYLDHVPVEIHWNDILFLNLLTLGIGIIVLSLPAILVKRISPIKALRFK